MSPSGTTLELQTSRLMTALYGVSLAVGAALVAFAVNLSPPAGFLAFYIGGVVAVTAYNTSGLLSRVRVLADGDLEVRNRLRTHRFSRADVDRVMVGQQRGPGSPRRVQLLLTDGSTLNLVVTEAPAFVERQRLQRQAALLREWLEAAPQH